MDWGRCTARDGGNGGPVNNGDAQWANRDERRRKKRLGGFEIVTQSLSTSLWRWPTKEFVESTLAMAKLGLRRRCEIDSRAWLVIKVGKRGGGTCGYLWGARRAVQGKRRAERHRTPPSGDWLSYEREEDDDSVVARARDGSETERRRARLRAASAD
jgi:hypothetical protein